MSLLFVLENHRARQEARWFSMMEQAALFRAVQ